jgi:sugar phosphate isomerase/epimerase
LIGVSPAYFISRFSDRFTPFDVAEGLIDLGEMGFPGFQLEVFHGETLDDWLNEGARLVRHRSHDLGLRVSQFVAHFMMQDFNRLESLNSDLDREHMRSVLDIVDLFEECSTITIPLGPFEGGHTPTEKDYNSYFDRLVEKFNRLIEDVKPAGLTLAVEILPSALIGGIDGFLRLCERLKSQSLKLNFDTGHAWASKENLYLIPAKLGKRIAGTHLCDNFQNENLSLRPGAGSIDWPRILKGLRLAGYDGWFDLEIICKPEMIHKEYREGRATLRRLLEG